MSAALALVEIAGEPRADSRVLAGRLKNDPQNVLALVERYASHFLRFGIVPFETEKLRRRGRPERFALLNEDQCYFLLSLSRNTQHVVGLKADLVAAFADVRAGRRNKGLGLFLQRVELETRDANSKTKARFGSRLMHERRREIPGINNERAALKAAMEPELFLMP